MKFNGVEVDQHVIVSIFMRAKACARALHVRKYAFEMGNKR